MTNNKCIHCGTLASIDMGDMEYICGPCMVVVLEDKPLGLPDYEEALMDARWYEERQREADVLFDDPIKGKGMLSVRAYGIMERSV